MKKNVWLLSLILLFASHLSIYGNVVTADSDSIRMRQVFAEMPDSILGILTKYNRLDCIDFIENNMPAKVENRLGGQTELKCLTEDYLSLQLTVSSRVEMKLLPETDGTYYICMAWTYSGPIPETTLKLYRQDWTEVEGNKWLKRPEYDDYWQMPDSVSESDVKRWKQMQDMYLIEVTLSADSRSIIFTLQPGEVEYGEAEKMKSVLRPISFVWNGRRFERQDS